MTAEIVAFRSDSEHLADREAEQFVIGMLLTGNRYLFKIPFLTEDHFFFPEHREIFRALWEKITTCSEVVTPVTLKSGLSSKELASYAASCAGMASDCVGIVDFAREVRDLADKRALADILTAAAAEVNASGGAKARDIIDGISQKCLEISKTSTWFKVKTLNDVLHEIIEEMQRDPEIFPTGFDKIDYTMSGGMKPGNTYCIAARPKCGKTMMKGSIAATLAKRHDKFLFVACEMGAAAIAKRIIGAQINRSSKAFVSDRKSSEFCEKIARLSGTASKSMLLLDAPRIRLSNLAAAVQNAVHYHGIRGFILDYLQLVTGAGKGETIAQHQENVAQTIAEICKKENIWCLYSAQINRDGDVRNGDGVAMACDWMYELRKIEKKYAEDPTMLYAKCHYVRDGEEVDIGSEERPAFSIARTGTHVADVAIPQRAPQWHEPEALRTA